MNRSDSIKEIAGALAKAQGAIQAAKKDSENPHFKAKYADLASVWAACREQLSSNGIAVVQAPGECSDGRVWLETMLLHSSGEWISELLSIPLAKVDAHGFGSALTYARRYALAAMVGVAPDDDDGNAAAKHGEAVSNGPAPRTKLDGPHNVKTKLKAEIHKIQQRVAKAASDAEITAIMRDAKETIKQASRDWPELIDGDPNIEEDIGLRAFVEERRDALAPASASYEALLNAMRQQTTRPQLLAWAELNEPFLGDLSDEERRLFEVEFDAYEGSLEVVGQFSAG